MSKLLKWANTGTERGKALAAKYKASFAVSAAPILVEGVDVVVFSVPYLGKEGGKHRGWFVCRTDNERTLVEYAPTKKAALANAAENLRYYGPDFRS